LLARGTLGTTIVDQFATLPASVRFFTGGSTTVRGYSYNSLGPKDANGEVVGGKYLLVGSLEFEHKFTPRWAWAVFYDIGNAIDDFNDPLKEGAGGGIRWQSPVGPVRLDVGFALSENTRPWEIHFNIGPDL
jgi:translocation and assembly module TamA